MAWITLYRSGVNHRESPVMHILPMGIWPRVTNKPSEGAYFQMMGGMHSTWREYIDREHANSTQKGSAGIQPRGFFFLQDNSADTGQPNKLINTRYVFVDAWHCENYKIRTINVQFKNVWGFATESKYVTGRNDQDISKHRSSICVSIWHYSLAHRCQQTQGDNTRWWYFKKM